MQNFTDINWDDLRYVVALSRLGTLSAAARALRVDHSTVGRRVASAEASLGLALFTRSASGYALTLDGARLLPQLRAVSEAVQELARQAQAAHGEIAGVIRVTAPETFGMTWLTARLCGFSEAHPGVLLELNPTGVVVNLSQGEAEVALRTVRSREQRLVVRRVADIAYGVYAAPSYLAAHPVDPLRGWAGRRWLAPPSHPPCVERRWLERLDPSAEPVITSELSVTLQVAAAQGAGLAILPCFLGDAAPGLERVPCADPPREALWLTVHEDARAIPRVRALLDYLGEAFEAGRGALAGAAPERTAQRA